MFKRRLILSTSLKKKISQEKSKPIRLKEASSKALDL